MRSRSLFVLAFIVAGCGGAIVGPETVGKQSVQINGVQMNGVQMNGVQMNGVQMNGVQMNGVQINGVQMNGVQMNGVQMNGVQMNGVQMNGVQINGVQMNGVAVAGLTLQGTWLTGSIVDSNSTCAHSQLAIGAALDGCSPCAQVVAAKDAHCATETWDQTCVNEAASWCAIDASQLVGATFHANTSGGTRTLRLDNVQLANDPAPVWRTVPGTGIQIDINADVWLYSFSYWQPPPTRFSRGRWLAICPGKDNDGVDNAAIPVAGQWKDCQGPGCGGKTSNDGFSLGCNDVGALAKCVLRYQYKPWHSVYETFGDASHYQTLEPFHEACVRMVRGDYCGDGTPNTVNNTPIDVYDAIGVQTETPAYGYAFEAGWTPSGAACISTTRFLSMGGSMSTPGVPAAVANCPQLAPVQWPAGSTTPIIQEGCGNAFDLKPNASVPLPSGTNDWPRRWYLIADDAMQPGAIQ